jgi:hypothetical protein
VSLSLLSSTAVKEEKDMASIKYPTSMPSYECLTHSLKPDVEYSVTVRLAHAVQNSGGERRRQSRSGTVEVTGQGWVEILRPLELPVLSASDSSSSSAGQGSNSRLTMDRGREDSDAEEERCGEWEGLVVRAMPDSQG